MREGAKIAKHRDDSMYRRALHERMLDFARQRATLDAEELQALFEVQRVRLWRDFGCASALEYLERVLGYAPHTAAERLRVAQELQQLPKLHAALGAGRLSFSAVRELSRVATTETEDAWIDAARGKIVRQIEDLVAHHHKGDMPTDDPDPTPKRCRLVYDELSPETFAAMRELRKRVEEELGGKRLDNDTFLQVVARRGISTSTETVTPPAYQIAFTRCEHCDRTWQNGAGVDLLVDRHVIERAECDAVFLGRLDAAVPERVTQSVTPRKRRQVFARDRYRCRVPGCRSSKGLDIHHVEFQFDGGSHELENLCLLCSGHHAQLHEGKLRVSGRAPDALRFEWKQRDWWIAR